jgi:DNA-binding CsgD family transcriptional regulator
MIPDASQPTCQLVGVTSTALFADSTLEDNLSAIEVMLKMLRPCKVKKHSSKDDLESLVRRDKAMRDKNIEAYKLRLSGMTFREIGKMLGIGPQGARHRVMWGKRHMKERERWEKSIVSANVQGHRRRTAGMTDAARNEQASGMTAGRRSVHRLVSHYVYLIPCISKSGLGVDQELQLPQ